MRIGTCVDFQYEKSMEELAAKFRILRDNGFDSCQLISWKAELRTPENLEELKRQLTECGIEISAFWCGWSGPAVWNFYEGPRTLGLLPEEYREMRVGQLCEGADFAAKLGVKDVVTHMGFIPEDPLDPQFEGFCDAVRTVAQHLQKNGQYLLFETGQETPVAMLRCFEKVGCDNLRVNLDTANLILYGKANPADALDVFGGYVRNLHAKDGFYPVNGHNLGRETRIGDGKVDFKAVFAKLHELGYDSYVTIEREISGDQQLADVLYAREYLQNVMKEVGYAG